MRLFVPTLVPALSACSPHGGSFMSPEGSVAAAQLSHLWEVVLLTLVAIVPVLILVPLILWRYRYGRRAGGRYLPDWGKSTRLDLLMWGVPFVIIAILSVLLWRSVTALDPYRPLATPAEATPVEVVGLDWKWLFLYPDLGIATVGEMAFPADEQLALELTSDTVMQSFIISALGGQIYVMPGMRTLLHVNADRPGIFEGENMQYSGTGFHAQKFQARALTDEDFAAWVANVRTNGQPLDHATYAILAARGDVADARRALITAGHAPNAAPPDQLWFTLPDTGLFAEVLGRYTNAEPVDPTAQPGSPLYRLSPLYPPTQATGAPQ